MAAPNEDHNSQPPLLGAYIWPNSDLKIGGEEREKVACPAKERKMSFSLPVLFPVGSNEM